MLLAQFVILQILVFAGVLFFLRKILFSDTQSVINRLDAEYQSLLKKQKDLSQQIETAEKEYAQKKEEATQVTNKMTTQAVEEIRNKKDEMIKQAKAEAEEIISKAKTASEQIRIEIQKDVYIKMTNFASNLLSHFFTEKASDILHNEILHEFIVRAKDFDLSAVDSQLETLVVKSPKPLTDLHQKEIKAFILSKLGRDMKIEVIEDRELIAGILLQFGTLMVDGSLANSLKEAALKEKQKIEKSS